MLCSKDCTESRMYDQFIVLSKMWGEKHGSGENEKIHWTSEDPENEKNGNQSGDSWFTSCLSIEPFLVFCTASTTWLACRKASDRNLNLMEWKWSFIAGMVYVEEIKLKMNSQWRETWGYRWSILGYCAVERGRYGAFKEKGVQSGYRVQNRHVWCVGKAN